MKDKLFAFLLATAGFTSGPALLLAASAAYAQEAEVSFSFFYDSLEPHGEWLEVGNYGLCWRPSHVSEDWAPYTDGYWSYTDGGWTWVSYEDFGGIVYHYGRWVRVEDTGWCWVPDYEWGPAWVSWRHTEGIAVDSSSEEDDYVGWAPLPPEARWEPEVGFSVQIDSVADIGPGCYNFCRTRDFGAPVIREVILPRPRNVVIIENTVNITNITVNNFYGGGRAIPFCGGPRFDYISAHVRRPIPTLKLVQETNITNINNINITNINGNRGGGRGRAIMAVQRGNQLIVPAPRIHRVENPLAALPNVRPARVIQASAVKVNRGWEGMRSPEEREKLREKFARQSREVSPERVKAKPLEQTALQPVPAKGDPNAPSPVATGNGKRPRGDRGAVANGVDSGNAVPADARGKGRRDMPGRGENTPATAQQPIEVNPGAAAADGGDERGGKGRPQRGANAQRGGANSGSAIPGEDAGAANDTRAAGPDKKGGGRQRGHGRGEMDAAPAGGDPSVVTGDPSAKENEIRSKGAGANRREAVEAARAKAQADRAGRQADERKDSRAEDARPSREVRAAREQDGQEAEAQAAARERQQAQRQAEVSNRQARERAAAQENVEQRQQQQRNVERAAQAKREAGEAAEMRRQQARQQAASEAAQAQRQQQQAARAAAAERQRDAGEAAEARQQQVAAQRAQAARQQAMESQRAAQMERAREAQQQQRGEMQQRARAEAQQRQMQIQQQQQVQQRQGGQRAGGNGGGEGQRGRGKRELTPEEAAALRQGR